MSDMFLHDLLEPVIEMKNNDITHENANVNGATPSGQMMQIASQCSKKYAHIIINPLYIQQHNEGYIHIHDLDYYAVKTTTCVQYDLHNLYSKKLHTAHCDLHPPQNIREYFDYAVQIFQIHQNEQHGGQAIPAFDFMMAPGVILSYIVYIRNYCKQNNIIYDEDIVHNIDSLEYDKVASLLSSAQHKHIIASICTEVYNESCYFLQAMNVQHSRGGCQVVFSSINLGTDTSLAGRMVTFAILDALEVGIGYNETSIFPIVIFKVKQGVTYSDEDMQTYKTLINNNIGLNLAQLAQLHNCETDELFHTSNFDLLVRSTEVSAKRLFPNYVFLDTVFNTNSLWNVNDPQRWRYEIATMGCRTRVYDNLFGEKTSISRGNISFTSINLVREAIEMVRALPDATHEQRLDAFCNHIAERVNSVCAQLYERMQYQATAFGWQFPFSHYNDVWKGLGAASLHSVIGMDVLKNGSLGVGFIGLAEALFALFGACHSMNSQIQEYGLAIVTRMRETVDQNKYKYQLNYSLLATPAEGLSGRFTRLDKEKYGILPGITDKNYYTNSFHVPVYHTISAYDKIMIEAPYHALCNGGHITYIELDSNVHHNTIAVLDIVHIMYKAQIGYGSINHPIDQCRACHYLGYIERNAVCPRCNSNNISRVRRITGYLVGSVDRWNASKQAEEADRVVHVRK